MLLGFDEFRTIHESQQSNEDISEIIYGGFEGRIEFESLFRERASGVWRWFEGIASPSLSKNYGGDEEVSFHFVTSETNHVMIPVAKLLDAVERAAVHPPNDAIHCFYLDCGRRNLNPFKNSNYPRPLVQFCDLYMRTNCHSKKLAHDNSKKLLGNYYVTLDLMFT